MKISLTFAFLSCVLLCCACANSRAKGGTAAVVSNLPGETADYQPPSQPDYPQVLAAPGPF